MSNRNIPKCIKNEVYNRQDGKCVCCMDYGREYHHLFAYSLNKEHTAKNIFLLCKNHHKLFHLGDPETYQCIYEYAYYLHKGELPEDPHSILTAEEVIELIKKHLI